MKDELKQTLISYRMQRAKESLEAAQLLSDNKMLTSSMNRIYYAMFYAVQALLVLKDTSIVSSLTKEFSLLRSENCITKFLNIDRNLTMSI